MSPLVIWVVIPGLLAIGVGLFAYFEHHPRELLPILERFEIESADGIVLNQVGAAIRAANLQDEALPQFVRLHFPPGMVGLFLAALMAAVMSSIDSGIHSVTTAIVIDFRDRLRPDWRPQDAARDVTLIRFLVVVIVSISIVLACFVGTIGRRVRDRQEDNGCIRRAAAGGVHSGVVCQASEYSRHLCRGAAGCDRDDVLDGMKSHEMTSGQLETIKHRSVRTTALRPGRVHWRWLRLRCVSARLHQRQWC